MFRPTLVVLAALALLVTGEPAQADLLKDAGNAIDDGVKKTKKVIKKVRKKVRKAGKVIEEETEETVEVVVDGSGKVIGEIDKTTGKVIDEADRTAGRTAHLALKGQKVLEKTFSKATVEDIVEGIDDVFNGAKNTPMWTAVVARITESRPAAERAAADTRALAEKVRSAGEEYGDAIEDIYDFVDKVATNPATQKKLGRLFQLVAKGKFGDETDRLAQWLGDEVMGGRSSPRPRARGAAASLEAKPATGGAPRRTAVADPVAGTRTGLPGFAYPAKSIAVTLGWNISAHVVVAGGLEGRFGVIMDVAKDGKVSDVRAIYTLAEGLGLGGSATGAGIDLGVDLMVTGSSMPVKNASGLFFGPSGSAGAGISGNIGLDWGWANGNPVPVAIPNLSAGPGITDPDPSVGVLVLYGYAVTANAKGFDHGIPGLPAR